MKNWRGKTGKEKRRRKEISVGKK